MAKNQSPGIVICRSSYRPRDSQISRKTWTQRLCFWQISNSKHLPLTVRILEDRSLSARERKPTKQRRGVDCGLAGVKKLSPVSFVVFGGSTVVGKAHNRTNKSAGIVVHLHLMFDRSVAPHSMPSPGSYMFGVELARSSWKEQR